MRLIAKPEVFYHPSPIILFHYPTLSIDAARTSKQLLGVRAGGGALIRAACEEKTYCSEAKTIL